jgi:hypothetical protein
MIVFAGQTVRAGIIQIAISEAGKASVTVNLGSGLEGPGTTPNNVTADVLSLNSTLDALGYDFHFNALGAVANSPGVPGPAFANLTGQVFRTTPGAAATIEIDASQNDYGTLAIKPGTMHNFITANFSGAPTGDVQTGTSYFNTSNVLGNTVGASSTAPLVFVPPGNSGSAPDVGVPSTPTFSLTDRLAVTLGPVATGGANTPFDQFTQLTQVTPVPEPASLALLGTGLPIVIMGLIWSRRRRPAAV